MMCCTPSGYIIFSLRNLKSFEGRGLDMRAGAGGRITQRPKQIQDAESLAEGNK